MEIDILPKTARTQIHMVFIVVPRFNIATLITMIETIRIANYLAPTSIFSWEVASFDGSKIIASNGMTATIKTANDNLKPAEFVFILGSWGTEHYHNQRLTAWLRKRARAGERICGVELGSYIVARAGLLDGKLATIHWSWLNGFKENFDRVEVEESLFTLDSKVMTCSGGLAGADQMLHHPIRSAASPQRSTMGRSTETMRPLLREAMTLIENNIEEPLTVPQIANSLGVSQRQLERQFKKNVGCTVVQFGVLKRLQNARLLLISTDMSIRQIATASGFNTMSHFAFSFGKFFGRRPSDYREAWPKEEPAPTWPGSLSDFLDTLNGKPPKDHIRRA